MHKIITLKEYKLMAQWEYAINLIKFVFYFLFLLCVSFVSEFVVYFLRQNLKLTFITKACESYWRSFISEWAVQIGKLICSGMQGKKKACVFSLGTGAWHEFKQWMWIDGLPFQRCVKFKTRYVLADRNSWFGNSSLSHNLLNEDFALLAG